MANKKTFLKIYLCFTAALLLIMAICLINVGLTLKDYEKSQPEHIAAENMTNICNAAKSGSLSSVIDLSKLNSTEISELTENLTNGSPTLKLTKSSEGGEKLVYSIVSKDDALIDISLSGENKGTKLLLFNMTEWSVSEVRVSFYNYELTLPKSLKLIVSGKEAIGTETESGMKYSVRSIKKPEVVIRDVLGNESVYNGKSFTAEEFVITVPNNYIITSGSGVVVPVTLAESQSGSEFGDLPEVATISKYTLSLVTKNPDIIIKDNFGGIVDYTVTDNTITITEYAGLPEIPETVISKDTVLSHAKKWSLFMTNDLGGGDRGYSQIAAFVLPDSELLGVARAWANGIDITFTSVHTLNNPPFHEESATNFIQYDSEHFSVDVKLSKVMHLNSGDDVTDTMNCRLYYTQKDEEWYVYDMLDLGKKTTEKGE